MGKIIGIDLGTTNSCVAVLDGDEPVVIYNSENSNTTPSVVAYDECDDVLVGDAAKRQAISNPENTLFAVKRLMGHQYYDTEVQRDIYIMPFNIVLADNVDAWVSVNGTRLAPPQILAEVLKKMKKTAEDFLGEEVYGAVISCPSCFNYYQRQAIKDAARIAGLDVMHLINDTAAAAVAYGEDNASGEKKVAVYDLGGGTFSFSIIDIDEIDGEKTFEVLSINGDTHLGGEDFDNRIINYLAEEFKRSDGIDLRQNKESLQRLKEAAENAKIELSYVTQTTVILPYITSDKFGPRHLNIKFTRAQLESLVRDLVEKTVDLAHTALSDANLSVSEIKDVILVGGQTRMPMIKKMVADFFGKEPRKDINLDEAVAVGAAIDGGVRSGTKNDVMLLEATSLSLGVETLGRMTPLIPKNTTVPARRSHVFTTSKDNQTSITINVLQGESKKASDNKSLGQFKLEGIDPAPRGMPQIEVSFDIDFDGLIHVSAQDKKTGKEKKVTIKSSSGLSDSDIERMIHESEARYAAQEIKARTQLTEERITKAKKWRFKNEFVSRDTKVVETKYQEETKEQSQASQQVKEQDTDNIDSKRNWEQEIETVRKMADHDIESARKYALEKFVRSLLPVYDSLEKALEYSDPNVEATKATLDGVQNTLDLFVKELNAFGVEVVDPTGKPFDPNFHQAVTMVPSPDVPANHVLNTMQKGFLLNGRVVRAAMVVVSKGV